MLITNYVTFNEMATPTSTKQSLLPSRLGSPR